MASYSAGGHLVSLDISWNGIEEGAGLIATALQKGGGAPLRVLKMSGSRPSDEVRMTCLLSSCLQLITIVAKF